MSDSSESVKMKPKPSAATDSSFGPTPDKGGSGEYGSDKIKGPKEPPKFPGT